jgi:hypothetical protein
MKEGAKPLNQVAENKQSSEPPDRVSIPQGQNFKASQVGKKEKRS